LSREVRMTANLLHEDDSLQNCYYVIKVTTFGCKNKQLCCRDVNHEYACAFSKTQDSVVFECTYFGICCSCFLHVQTTWLNDGTVCEKQSGFRGGQTNRQNSG